MDEWILLLDRLTASFRRAGEPDRVMAAVSGGADSVALLLALNECRERLDFSLFAVHVDHGLRPDSGEDAAFVSRLCQRLCVPCRVIPVRVTASGEDGARQARYNALFRACAENDCDAIALAHHQRDHNMPRADFFLERLHFPGRVQERDLPALKLNLCHLFQLLFI